MPVDSKRLPVPEDTFSLQLFAKKPVSNRKALTLPDGKRCDGRLSDQIRPIFMKTGIISRAKGSSYIEMNETKIICAVYGPREVTRREDFSMRGQLNCELKFATFSGIMRRQHMLDTEEKDLSMVITQALEPTVILEKFPKSRMDIFITVLQDDGGALSGALTCASVALADAGIEMFDLVVGCNLRCSNDIMLMDPTKHEEYEPRDSKHTTNSGSLCVGLMPALHQVTAFTHKGEMTLDSITQASDLAIEGCQQIYPVIQEILGRSVRVKLKSKLGSKC